MKKQSNTDVTPLSVMLGSGELFFVRDGQPDQKQYICNPILLEDIDEVSSHIHTVNIMFNITKNNEPKFNKFLSKYVFDSNGEAMTTDKLKADKWTVVDLKRCIQKVCELSD